MSLDNQKAKMKEKFCPYTDCRKEFKVWWARNRHVRSVHKFQGSMIPTEITTYKMVTPEEFEKRIAEVKKEAFRAGQREKEADVDRLPWRIELDGIPRFLRIGKSGAGSEWFIQYNQLLGVKNSQPRCFDVVTTGTLETAAAMMLEKIAQLKSELAEEKITIVDEKGKKKLEIGLIGKGKFKYGIRRWK